MKTVSALNNNFKYDSLENLEVSGVKVKKLSMNLQEHFKFISDITRDDMLLKIIFESIIVEYNCRDSEDIDILLNRIRGTALITIYDLSNEHELNLLYNKLNVVIKNLFSTLDNIVSNGDSIYVDEWSGNSLTAIIKIVKG